MDYPPSEVSVVMNSSQDVSDDSSAEDENYLRSVMDSHFTNNKASTSSLPTKSKDVWKETKENSVELILPQTGESSSSPPRSKLPQSDASTSTTLPVSDSSCSQQRSTPSYNPITNYSPLRKSRRVPVRISGASLNRSPHLHGYFPPMYDRPHSSDEGDCSSIDSDEALERWAHKIRTELRHAEMVELAIEAERAAEAGEERFAGKPSTFGLDDTDAVIIHPTERQDLRRRKTYSEGTRIPMLHNRTNKIGILALRDIDEVFPSFRQFNTHLRTHFARSQVDEKTLVYYEKEAVDEREPPLRHRKIISPQRLQREGRRFLENFSLDKWVGPRNESMHNGASNHASVGHLLAEHIHNSRQRTPDIDLPPGLELPEIPARSMPDPSATRKNPQSKSAKSWDPTLVRSNSEPEQHSPGVPSPRSLFDQDDGVESDTEDYTPEVSSTVLTPKTSHRGRRPSNFVTPARLRVIRNNTGLSSVDLPLILSPNTIIREHETPPPRSSDLAFTAQTRTGESVNSLLLPTFRRRDENQQHDIFDESAWLKPANSKDASDKCGMSADKNGAAFPLPAESGIPLTPPTENLQPANGRTFSNEPVLSTPPHSPILSAKRGEREDADAPREDNRRVVKVSVVSQGKGNLHEKQNERAKTLEESQVVATEVDPERCDSIRTPQQPCNCLTLSPASSLESTSSFREIATGDLDKSNQLKTSHRSHRSLQKSTSAGNLQSEIEQMIWNPCVSKSGLADGNDEFAQRKPFRAAMDMIATLSPKNQMFLRKRSTLYVRPEVNDEFLHNYLYCSKPKDKAIQDDNVVCAEPCQDGNVMCGDLHMDMCCVSSALADSALRLGPRKTSLSDSILSLSRETSYSKLEPESWFDLANEHFDGVLEQLVGSANHHSSQWNVSFQAPGLKKNPGSSMKPPRVDLTTTSAAHAPLETSDTDIDFSIPQPLFEAPQETLSDTQFQLIYGMSRDAIAAAANRTEVDESMETAMTPPRDSNRNAQRDEISVQTLDDVIPPGNHNASADIVIASKSL